MSDPASGSQYRSLSLLWRQILTVETGIVVELVHLEVVVNICSVLLHRWSLCGDNDAGKDDKRCFIAGNGNSFHLRCITALLFHVFFLKNQLYKCNISRHTHTYSLYHPNSNTHSHKQKSQKRWFSKTSRKWAQKHFVLLISVSLYTIWGSNTFWSTRFSYIQHLLTLSILLV